MLANELISPIIPVVNELDSPARALRLMNEYHLSQLPLVDEDQYICLLEENGLLDLDDPEILLKNVNLPYLKPAVKGNVHFFEALKLAGNFKLSLVPVIDDEGHYIGSITQENLLFTLAHFNGIHESGGILVLEIDQNDFMLSEISRLAESEDIRIHGVYTFNDPSTNKLQVILKTNRQNLNTFIATLERFHYTIQYRFDEPPSGDDVRENYDLLMNYLNM